MPSSNSDCGSPIIVAQVRAWFSRSPVALSTSSASTQIAPLPERNQRHPMLWAARSSDARRKTWCGPVVVAATIGVDVATVSDVIKRHRNGRPVKGTHPNELQLAFRHFGYDMALLADLRSKAPTLATWERERAASCDDISKAPAQRAIAFPLGGQSASRSPCGQGAERVTSGSFRIEVRWEEVR